MTTTPPLRSPFPARPAGLLLGKLSALILAGILQATGPAAHAAIFGADLREPVTEASPYRKWSGSTAISLLSSNVEPAPSGHIRLKTDPLEGAVCPEERFSTDQSLSYSCTGFLVAPDIIATAGHCMVNTGESRHETETFCKEYSWLFDFQADAQGRVNVADIDPERVYHCKEVIYAVKDERAPFRDFALVRLKRPVRDRPPLLLRAEPISANETLTMIGYPLGTPAKASPGGRILLNDLERQSFITNLSAQEGNSGSPVWDSEGRVAGILVGGTPDISLLEDEKRHCRYYNRCDANGEDCLLPNLNPAALPGFQRTGSEVQRIGPVLDMLRELEPVQGLATGLPVSLKPDSFMKNSAQAPQKGPRCEAEGAKPNVSALKVR